MIMKKLFILFIFQFLFNTSFSQDKDLKNEAAYAFDSKDYKKSYELYDKLYTQSPKNLEYKFRLGYSSLYYPEKKARSIEIFESLKTQDKSADANYYLAKAYHFNYRFDDAIVAYELYISTVGNKIKAEDKPLIEDAKHGILNCENGKELITKKVIADIKNIGSPLNTNEQEYVPVISTDESILIYTYVGSNTTGGKVNEDLKPDNEDGYFHEDIYFAKKATDTTFTAGQNISNSINTKGHDAAIALSPDGSTLFTFSSTNTDNGDIYTSKLKGEEWSTPERLNSNINTTAWEGSCSITSDGRYLYFASERPGGLGGRDLYISEKVNGDWGPAINLGPQINTEYNEDAPFIHPDGITLFFSSQGHKSIGGYDIMYSIKQENNWIEPLSMGIPLNTTEDDRYYVINAKGDRGYFSSNRGGSGGKGGQDIYTVEPGILGERPILALLKGSVYADDKPTEAKIEIIKKSNNEAIGPYYANSKTGKYLMALSPGNGYKIRIIITVPGFDPIEEELDVEKLTKFVEIKKDFYVYTETFANKKEQKSVKSILDSLLGNVTNVDSFKNDVVEVKTNTVTTTPTVSVKTNPCSGAANIDFSQLKGKSLNNPDYYKKLLEIGGTTCAQGLIFKIQIAAYQFPQNYKYDRLKEFGAPEITNYPDGVTRFTQLQFATLNEAEVARQKIIAKGQTDAWITGFVDGKRYTLEELISVNFFGKSIN